MTTKEFKGLAVYVKKGFEIPEGYLKALDKYDHNTYGMVCINKNGSHIDIGYVPGKTTHQGVYDWMRRTNAKDRLLYFGLHPQLPKDQEEANRQPFLILNKNAKPFLACVLTGEFSKHIPPGNTENSAEFFCANTKIMPDLQQIFRLCKDDPKQFWDEVKSAATSKRISDMIGLKGGVVSIFAASNGDDVGVQQLIKSTPQFGNYEWGTVTDNLGYVFDKNEKPAPITAATVAPKKKFAVTVEEEPEDESKSPDLPIVGDEPPVEPEKKIEIPPLSSLAEKKADVTTPHGGILRMVEVAPGEGALLYYPPPHITKRKALKKDYKEACGRDLTNRELEQRIGVVPKAQWIIDCWTRDSKSLTETADAATLVKDLVGSDAPRIKAKETTLPEQDATNKVTGSAVKVPLQEEEATHYPTSSVHEDRPSGASPIYSVITPKDKAGFRELTKNLDKNGQVISDPTVAQDMENSQNFNEEIGYPGLSATFGWKDDFIFNLMQNAPRIAIRWTLALRRRIELLEKELASKDHDTAIEHELVASFTPKRKRA